MKLFDKGNLNRMFAHFMIPISLFFVLMNFVTVTICFAGVSSQAQSFFSNRSSYEFPLIKIDPSEENDFSTPVAWYNDSIYTVNVEPPDGVNNRINLKTVVRKGTIRADGTWTWEKNVIENRTLDDRYHTQPSIAVDKNGYIHIVYNMHNMPWQYKVSKRPDDISEFEFKGEALSTEQLKKVKYENKTPFPYIETAAIPGTQITYPAFFKDRNNELYITYRFATRPKQSWANRGFAGGIAKYDAVKKKWEAIGGSIKINSSDALYPDSITDKSYTVSPFAYYDKWSVYLIRLHFDKNNAMHVSWTWREGGAGSNCSDPSYAYVEKANSIFKKANGVKYSLPITVGAADIISQGMGIDKFYALTSISSDKLGQPYIVLNSIGSSRVLVYYDSVKNKWSEPEKTPGSATEIYIDDSGKQWAFASGINVFSRDNNDSKWDHVLSEEGYGWPKIIYMKELKGFFVHALSKDCKKCKLIWIKAGDVDKIDKVENDLITPPRNVRLSSK